MKVYIGPYKNWFGPYELAEFLCFWAKKKKDEYGFERNSNWIHNFGEWLAYGSVEPDSKPGDLPKSVFRESEKTWLYKFLLWIDSKRKRIVYVKIDKYDTWNMDSTLTPIILPMLKQLKETKHGSFYVDDEDVPKEFHTSYQEHDYDQLDLFPEHKKEADEASWNLIHSRCEWVMNEMIWAFEQLNTDWESQFHSGYADWKEEVYEWDENEKPLSYKLIESSDHTSKFDAEGYRNHSMRIDNGLKLFGKYYRGLWD